MDKLIHKYLTEGLDDVYNKYYAQAIPEREVFNRIIAIDPTYNPNKDKMGNYGQWLINQYKKGEDVFGEEHEYKDQIDIFNRSKNKLPQDKRDISRVKTLKDLIELNASMEQQVSKSELQLKAEEHPGAKFICKSDNWEVYQPETYEASKFLRGDDAVWCTGRHNDDSFWKSYTKDGGKLFIFINTSEDKTRENTKFQVAIKDNRVREFRDARNNSADFMEFIGNSGLYDALGQTEIAQTKDYQVVKQIKDTNGKILYSNLMAIKFTPEGSSSDLFKALQNFVEVIIVNDGLKVLLPDAFEAMKAKKIILPDSLESLSVGCFNGCDKLKKISLPEKIRVIPPSCFAGCSSLEEVKFGTGLTNIKINAFEGCPESLQLKTPHHKITIPKAELDWYKKHIVWTDDVTEELTEGFSRDIPEWIKPYFVNRSVQNGYRGNNIIRDLLDSGIDVNKVKIINKRMPKDKKDPIFSDPNKILIFYIPKENCSTYRNAKNWGSYDNGDIVYIKDVNNPTVGYYASDAMDKRTPYQLINIATKMAYIDKNDPNNFIKKLRLDRQASKAGSLDRDKGYGQRRDVDWIMKSKDPKFEDRVYSSNWGGNTRGEAFRDWKENGRLGWQDDSPRIQDVYERPQPIYKGWSHPGDEANNRRYGSIYDKSGFNVTLARHNLKVKLNDYRKHNYQQTLDNMRNNLEIARKIIIDLFNDSLSDITVIDDSNVTHLFKKFKDCAANYSKILSRLDYIEQMDDKEAQEKELDSLFSYDRQWNSSFGLTVRGVESDIRELLKELSAVETTYIESLKNK